MRLIINHVLAGIPMSSDETLGTADLGLLYRTHHSWLQGWLIRRIGCRDNAADLAQDTFVRLLKSRQSSPLREPRAYLSSIARGLMIDQYRRRELERAYLESVALLPQHEVPSEESRLMILDALERIDRMLGMLKPRVRQAFLFARLDGLTCAQIAEKLGVSRATVERDLATALQHCYRLRYVES
ncbi:RNA polymerase sigma-70 factor (ECF subfamily) [Pseudomonas kilonensis]